MPYRKRPEFTADNEDTFDADTPFHPDAKIPETSWADEPMRLVNASSVAEKLRADLAKSRPFPTGTVIAWESVAHTGTRYAYAAVFASSNWYTTISGDNRHLKKIMTHAELMHYFSERGDHLTNLRVATNFERVTL